MTGETIWCAHCKADISRNGVLSCLRKKCESKAKVPPEQRTYRQ